MNEINNNKDIKINNEKKQLGIYIHIPFCVKKCDYCDFLSGPATTETQKRYVDALIEEIGSYKNAYKDYEVATIFIGGGTPSILEENDIVRIMDALYKNFSIYNQDHMEITIECNPGTITKDKLLAYKEAKINRISFGLQSTNNHELAILGRIHTYEEFYDNYQLARELGFHNINVDLMSALPGQDLQEWETTLNRIVSLQPEHISAYSLIIEEGTPYYSMYGEQKKNYNSRNSNPHYALPDEDTERKIYKTTQQILEGNDYHSYEISNYSKIGYECKHNSSYWNRVDYLGLGLGASSLINNTRYHNTDNITHYIENSQNKHKIREDIQTLSLKDQMEEFMFLGLRLKNGISKEDFHKAFGKSIQEVYHTPLSKLLSEKLIIESPTRIYLTERGIDISNYVLAEFLL